jgi:hypothetical protein
MEETEIIAHIELKEDNNWMIRVVDTTDNEGYICESIDEFSFAVAQLGGKHDNLISVKWSKDPDVTPKHFNEVEAGIRKLQEVLNGGE